MRRIVLVVHNVRSAHNVGSLLRTADGLGINKVYLTGYTPYPPHPDDERLPHQRQKIARGIHKAALGAEQSVDWEHFADIKDCLSMLKQSDFTIAALEQTDQAVELAKFKSDKDLALVVGNEVEGLERPVLDSIEQHLQIPMLGHKESFNVAIAGAIALYHLKYITLKSSKNSPLP